LSDLQIRSLLNKRTNAGPDLKVTGIARRGAAAVILSVMTLAAFSQNDRQGRGSPLLDTDLWEAVISEYSAEAAAKHIREISRFHRIAGGGPGYHHAVEYVAGFMKSLGPFEVDIDKHISDGDRMYLQWRSMAGWDVRKAELRIEPSGEIITRYADTPVCLFEYSNGADISAPSVFVGPGDSGSDYGGVDVAGKIVLATGDGEAVHREAVLMRGAAGVVVGPSPADSLASLYPDLVRVQRLRSNKSLREKSRFGFSLSSRQFQTLLSAVQGRPDVRLSVQIDARQYDAEAETISAVLKGSQWPEQEMILSAHLDHYSPGANDNASGSASLLEIARCLTTLIDRGVVARPKRSIRFLWVGEMHGFAGYLAKDISIGKRGIAGLNMDMVGEDIQKTQSVMTLIRPPDSNPGFIGDLVEHFMLRLDARRTPSSLGESERIHFRVLPFKGGSDHFLLSDPTIGVPSVNLGHDGDVFHHTSMDDLDKIDKNELKKSGIIALSALLVTVNAEDEDALSLAYEVSEQATRRISERTSRWMMELGESWQRGIGGADFAKDCADAIVFLDARSRAEIATVKTVEALCGHDRVRTLIAALGEDIRKHTEAEKAKLRRYCETLWEMKGTRPPEAKMSADEAEFRTIIPRRVFRGPLSQYYFEDLLGDDAGWYTAYGRKDPDWSSRRAEILNFMDGRRNLLEIYQAVGAELGRSETGFYRRLLSDLKKHGLVSY
jgi:aminopeptidase YwaD